MFFHLTYETAGSIPPGTTKAAQAVVDQLSGREYPSAEAVEAAASKLFYKLAGQSTGADAVCFSVDSASMSRDPNAPRLQRFRVSDGGGGSSQFIDLDE